MSDTNNLGQSRRARNIGGNRGGCGPSSERTDPDWEDKRIRRMRAEYDSLDASWQRVYLEKLSKWDKHRIINRRDDG